MAAPRLPEPFQRISVSISSHHKDERPEIDEAQSLALHALGEAAYKGCAFGQGAAMDEDEVADHALREFRRLQTPNPSPGMARLTPPGRWYLPAGLWRRISAGASLVTGG